MQLDVKKLDPDIAALIVFLNKQGYITRNSCSGYGLTANGEEHPGDGKGYIEFEKDFGLCEKIIANWNDLCQNEKPPIDLKAVFAPMNNRPGIHWRLHNPDDFQNLQKIFQVIRQATAREKPY